MFYTIIKHFIKIVQCFCLQTKPSEKYCFRKVFTLLWGMVYILGMPTNFKITKVNQLHISAAKIGRNLCLDNIVETWSTPHCPKLKMNSKKPSKWWFHVPGLLEAFLMLIFFFFFLTWTLEIIQFILFEMHMDRPGKSKFFLGH